MTSLKQRMLSSRSKTTTGAKSLPKVATIAAYAGVFLFIISIIAVGYQAPRQIDPAANAIVPTAPTTTPSGAQPSVDQLVATNIAAGIAERTDLPIAKNVANLSVSLTIQSQLTQGADDVTVVAKPQIIQPTASGHDFRSYTAVVGDTAQAVAAKYQISSDTLKWANDLTSDALTPGANLTIPPVDGVVYTVKSGDTADSLASRYNADKNRIISFNNLEISGVTSGQRIMIPGGVLPENERPGYSAPRTNYGGGSGYVVNSDLARAAVGNRYAYGNCTWYAYNRRAELGMPVGSFWGNANTWAANARAAGYLVDGNPSAGAVLADQSGYFGHVAVVESVYPDGSILISEMNNYAYGGFGVVDNRTIPAGSVRLYQYIH